MTEKSGPARFRAGSPRDSAGLEQFRAESPRDSAGLEQFRAESRLDSPEPERFHAETAAEWRAWLAAHPGRTEGVWLVSWKAATGRPRTSYQESVEEALCFGWVDSKSNLLDGERSMLWFAPRRRGSAWARTNKERIERLEREGRMTDAGRRVVEQARADGTWSMLDSVEDLIVPDDLASAFDARPGSREAWESFPKSVRRANLEWIVQARTPETRAKRVEEIATRAAEGERANQWRRRE